MEAQQGGQQVQVMCPGCHVAVKVADYYCFNCGKALQEKPRPVTVWRQIGVYAGSVLLPPLGFIWGWRYLRQSGRQSKMVGLVAIGLTVVSLAAAVVWSIDLFNQVNTGIEEQMSILGGV